MQDQFGKLTTPTTATTMTPRKRGKAANGETPSKSATKRKTTEVTGDDDDEVEGESPSKKQDIKKEHVFGDSD